MAVTTMSGVAMVMAVVMCLCLLQQVHLQEEEEEEEGLVDREGGKYHQVAIKGGGGAEELSVPSHRLRGRFKRESTSDKNVKGFSAEQKKVLVDKHNYFRRKPNAADMNHMVWDDGLEALAQNWAENCDFNHRPSAERKKVAGYDYAGENLYAGTGGYDPASVLQAWYDEVDFYNYNTMACTSVCGHYTQMVWATSRAIGCGVAYCPVLKGVSFGRGFHVACNYGPGGNYLGERPYKAGPKCSQCMKDFVFCIDGLCSQTPVIDTSDGDSSAATQPLTALGCLLLSLGLTFVVRAWLW